MFVYNFKKWEIPDIETFKKNINTEIDLVEYGLSSQIDNKDKVLKAFINLSIQTYLNITNISILSNFSEAFTLINEIEQNLHNLQNILTSLKTFVDSTDIDYGNEENKNKYLNDLQEILENYYSTKYEVQPKILQKTKQFNELYEKMEKINTSAIIAPPPIVKNLILQYKSLKIQNQKLKMKKSFLNLIYHNLIIKKM